MLVLLSTEIDNISIYFKKMSFVFPISLLLIAILATLPSLSRIDWIFQSFCFYIPLVLLRICNRSHILHHKTRKRHGAERQLRTPSYPTASHWVLYEGIIMWLSIAFLIPYRYLLTYFIHLCMAFLDVCMAKLGKLCCPMNSNWGNIE